MVPEGWLCARTMQEAPAFRAVTKTILGSTMQLEVPPVATSEIPMQALALLSMSTLNCSTREIFPWSQCSMSTA